MNKPILTQYLQRISQAKQAIPLSVYSQRKIKENVNFEVQNSIILQNVNSSCQEESGIQYSDKAFQQLKIERCSQDNLQQNTMKIEMNAENKLYRPQTFMKFSNSSPTNISNQQIQEGNIGFQKKYESIINTQDQAKKDPEPFFQIEKLGQQEGFYTQSLQQTISGNANGSITKIDYRDYRQSARPQTRYSVNDLQFNISQRINNQSKKFPNNQVYINDSQENIKYSQSSVFQRNRKNSTQQKPGPSIIQLQFPNSYSLVNSPRFDNSQNSINYELLSDRKKTMLEMIKNQKSLDYRKTTTSYLKHRNRQKEIETYRETEIGIETEANQERELCESNYQKVGKITSSMTSREMNKPTQYYQNQIYEYYMWHNSNEQTNKLEELIHENQRAIVNLENELEDEKFAQFNINSIPFQHNSEHQINNRYQQFSKTINNDDSKKNEFRSLVGGGGESRDLNQNVLCFHTFQNGNFYFYQKQDGEANLNNNSNNESNLQPKDTSQDQQNRLNNSTIQMQEQINNYNTINKNDLVSIQNDPASTIFMNRRLKVVSKSKANQMNRSFNSSFCDISRDLENFQNVIDKINPLINKQFIVNEDVNVNKLARPKSQIGQNVQQMTLHYSPVKQNWQKAGITFSNDFNKLQFNKQKTVNLDEINYANINRLQDKFYNIENEGINPWSKIDSDYGDDIINYKNQN